MNDSLKLYQQLVSVRDYLRYAISCFSKNNIFFGHGCSNAFDEAAFLILRSLHLPVDQLDPFLDAQLTVAERMHILEQINKRIEQRMPAPYLVKEAWLQNYRFFVDERTIVPRSFIAELLVQGLSPWIDVDHPPHRILDLCTGSGCLAIIAADVFPNCQVDAVDISSPALTVAKKNVEQYALQDQVALIESDLFSKLPTQHYDLIMCNPPYVNSASMDKLPDEYKWEPELALAGGSDGMDLIRTILRQAPNYLKSNAMLLLEIGNEKIHFEQAFPHLNPIWLDTSGGDEMVLLLSKSQLTTNS